MEKLLCSLVLAASVLTGCSKELQVTVASDVTVEYGEELDNSVLFNADESDENVSVKTVDGFDATKLGEQTLTVTLTDGDKEVTITVEDTQNPEITLDKEEVTITVGDKITLKDNVKEVSDPVDGELEYAEEEVETNGYYINKGDLDTSKAGTYEVTVIAKDKNGNEAKKTFKVVVKEKSTTKTDDTSSSSDSSTSSSSLSNKSSSSSTTSSNNSSNKTSNSSSSNSSSNKNNSSSGSQSSSGSSSSNSSNSSSSQTCTTNGQFGRVGNSGKVFYDHDEAEEWAWNQIEGGPAEAQGYSGFHMWTVYDNCGERNDVWTVDFY